MRFLSTGGRDWQTEGWRGGEAQGPKRQSAGEGKGTLAPDVGVNIAGAGPPR